MQKKDRPYFAFGGEAGCSLSFWGGNSFEEECFRVWYLHKGFYQT